jgi:hypothetical protein
MGLKLWSLAALLSLLVTSAMAQNPRERRDAIANPPRPAPQSGQMTGTVDPSRWGTVGAPVGQPQWGTKGASGWSGNATPRR